MPDQYKIVIVGASSLRGKELNDALAESPFASANFVLLDEEEQIGQLEAVGDEVALIQRIEPGSFRRADFVFFAGSDETTHKHWRDAHQAGASIVDMTGAMEPESGVLLRAPWLQETGEASVEMPSLTTPALVSPNAAAIALALLMQRLEQLGKVHFAAATVLEPASEYGRAGMDELHQQTVSLLNFQSLPRMVYDTQVAFNVTPVFGEAARFQLAESETRLRRHYAVLRGAKHPLLIQLVHAPTFHGYCLSLAVEFDQVVEPEHVEATLQGEHVDVILGDADAPTNLSSAGQSDVLVRVRTADGTPKASRQYLLWAAFDNLKIASLNAVACAAELQLLRPKGKVQ